MSVPPISSISSTIQPPIPVGSASESVLLAAQAMTSASIASTSTVSSTSQYSAETLLAILERPSTSPSQSVDVVMETPDLEVILPSKDPTVAIRPLVHLCDPTSVTLPLHSTHFEHSSSHETPAHFGTQNISSVSGHFPGPPVLSPQLPFSYTNRLEIYNILFSFYNILQIICVFVFFCKHILTAHRRRPNRKTVSTQLGRRTKFSIQTSRIKKIGFQQL